MVSGGQIGEKSKPRTFLIPFVGGMQDWNYVNTNDFEITLEIGCYKYPPRSQLTTFWDENRAALTAYLERVHQGIKGFVMNQEGNPLTNATIQVQGIRHQIKVGQQGDYFRLLLAGTYNVTALYPGFDAKTLEISVPHSLKDPETGAYSAKVVNFTLSPDTSGDWSQSRDFSIAENLKAEYLTNSRLEESIANMENDFYETVEVFMNEAEWSSVISVLVIKDKSTDDKDEDKVNVALFGGVYGSQPVGRELLIRLARHLGTGYKQDDSSIKSLLSKMNVYIIPMVDTSGFDNYKMGTCEYASDSDIHHEPGSKFRASRRTAPPSVKAVKTFLSVNKIHVALSVESHGMFMRMPWDDADSGQSENDPSLKYLAQSYFDAHQAMHSVQHVPCEGFNNENPRPVGLMYGKNLKEYTGTLLDYAYSTSTSIVAAHVSCCNFPDEMELPKLWMANMEPLMAYLEAASQGIYGQVTDIKGNPLPEAVVKLNNIKTVPLDKDKAFFNIPLPEGKMYMTLELDNYESKSIEINVMKGQRIRKKIVLDHAIGEDLVYHPPQTIGTYLQDLAQRYQTQAR